MEMHGEKFCTGLLETTETLPTNGGGNNPIAVAVVPDGSAAPESSTSESWKDQLDVCKQRIEALQEECEQSFLEIGRVLVQARTIYKGHGNWLAWLRSNVPFSVRHAQRLMRVAEMFDDATLGSHPGLTASKAYILTRVDKQELPYFFESSFPVGSKTKTLEELTKRELEDVVTAFLKGKLATANNARATSNQVKRTPKESVELDFEKLKEVLAKTIASIKRSTPETRGSWISQLEELCLSGVDELTSASE